VTTTLRQELAACALPRLEAHMLWQHILGVSRAWLIGHDTDPLPDEAVATFQQLCRRREAGEPMAYIVGWREFMGHRFRVSPGVLIPRPDTELLVETALAQIGHLGAHARVLDLGTGSGAIAISVALARPDITVVATDASEEALAIAQRNAHELHARVEFYPGNWYEALPAGMDFDLIVSNPPYIAAADPHLQQGDLRFEPDSALTDGADGLSDLQRIIDGAPARLRRPGALFLEHGWDQAAVVRNALIHAGFHAVRSIRDLAGIERVSGGLYN
jgi:release factor glutamine methyltransferase